MVLNVGNTDSTDMGNRVASVSIDHIDKMKEVTRPMECAKVFAGHISRFEIQQVLLGTH